MKTHKKSKIFCKRHKLFIKDGAYFAVREVSGMKKGKTWAYLTGGALTGIANGLFGGGGGMITVPFLERAAGYPTPNAHATAIAVILPASLVSGIVYLWSGVISLNVLLPVVVGVAAGGYLGAKLLPIVPEKTVSLLFAFFMLAAGLRMIF